MPLILGPVLSFRGSDFSTWNVSVLVVVDSNQAPPLTFSLDDGTTQTTAAPTRLKVNGTSTAFRYDLALPRPAGPKEAKVDYSVGGTSATFYCPGTLMPLQSAYCSCNGFSSASAMKSIGSRERHEMWKSLLAQHKNRQSEREPKKSHYHVLLMGGDQLYADSIFAPNSPLGAWSEMAVDDRLKFKVTTAMRRQLADYYFNDLYCARWSQEGVKEALASIPTVMMWDDHDIFDGWGSYPKNWQNCEVHQALFAVATDCFRTFQLQLPANASPPGSIPKQDAFSSYLQIDDVGILALDLRSDRTEEQVISPKNWDAIYAHLDALANSDTTPKHLLVMLSIPVVYPNFEFAERFFGWIPGQQELEDDMRDHWRSQPHREERLRLIHNLFSFAKNANCRVTMLSGDVHVPALGILQNKRADLGTQGNAATITQLISSGIVHPSGGALFVFALDKLLAGWDEEVDRDITSSMAYLPGTQSYFKAARNWLALEFDTDTNKRLWATWRFEGEKYPITKVIHPV